MAWKKDQKAGVFGTRSGGDILTTPAGGGGNWAGYGGGRATAMGTKTQSQARAAQPGSNVAKNFRASGKAGASVNKGKSPSGKSNMSGPGMKKWFGF